MNKEMERMIVDMENNMSSKYIIPLPKKCSYETTGEMVCEAMEIEDKSLVLSIDFLHVQDKDHNGVKFGAALLRRNK